MVTLVRVHEVPVVLALHWHMFSGNQSESVAVLLLAINMRETS